MTSGLDKIKAGMYPVIDDLLTVNTVFLFQVRVKTGLDIFNNGPPTTEDIVLNLRK